VDVARATQALAPRVAPSFLKSKEYLKYSIENIQLLVTNKLFHETFLPCLRAARTGRH